MTIPSKFDVNVYRDNAWRYFEIHADQRLKMFQFFITISTALLGGSLLIVKLGKSQDFLIILGLFSSFISFIFWKLDIRTRNLIKNAEEAIKYLDDEYEIMDVNSAPSPLKLFTRDDYFVRGKLYKASVFGHFSYRRCFECVFVVVGGLGVVATFVGILQFL